MSHAHITVEATGATWAFVDAMHKQGADVCVVDTRKTRLQAGYATKTDRLDARRLADALRRQRVVSIYIPPPGIRELRELCRGRQHVVRTRTKLVQTIRALLLRHDVADPPMTQLHTPAALTWREQVALPGAAGDTLPRLRRVIADVQTEVRAAHRDVVAAAQRDPIASALTAMTGIGPVLALMLRAQIGDIQRFPAGKSLASYAGLVPHVDASANRIRYGRTRAKAHRGCDGRWSKSRCMRSNARTPWDAGRDDWAVRKGIARAREALARQLCDELVRRWPRAG